MPSQPDPRASPSAMDSGGGSSAEVELAWHLLTVLIRLGHPAAPSELAAAAAPSISTRVVERMCSLPGSPLWISDDGVVTPSETAVLAFLRFMGWGAPGPTASLRPPVVRRWPGKVSIGYGRKRQGSDARCFGAKRRRLLAPDADLVEQTEHQSGQLVAQTCTTVASGEVHLEVLQKLQDRLPTLGTFLGEPSLGLSNVVTLAPNIAKITMLHLQTKHDQPLRADDGTVSGNMSLALVPTRFSDCLCSVNLPPLDAEKLKKVNVEVDGKSNKISESEQVSLLNCRVEDSDDLQESVLPMASHDVLVGDSKNGADEDLNLVPLDAEKSKNINVEVDGESNKISESKHVSLLNCRVEDSDDLQKVSVLPMASHDVLVGESKNRADEDLNLVRENHGSPVNHNTKAADSIGAFDMILNQADALQYNLNDGCVQEKNPLVASAYAEVCTDKTTEILSQPSMDNKAGSIASQLNTNVQCETLPQESTRQDGMNMKNLNIVSDNRDIRYLNHGEQSLNKVEFNVSKNGRDKLAVKQKEKYKKNEQTKEDKDHTAKTQKGHVPPKPLPAFKGFVIEEEEGSGGYGTVYRAKRTKDGKIFAIKCPHPNAHSHHVNNELKMLERFGGKSFVIKYECSLKSGDLACFVLEHVEHDRPEVLKRDITLLELQWYGHCLFRALASLHRQGVVHRDVKPGNFLFCRKQRRGYLIDFNLANDLHQKFLKNCKSDATSSGKDTTSQTLSTIAPVVHAKEPAADSKQPLPLKRKRSSRSPVDNALAPKIDNKSRRGNQAADVSGVTSAKDPTSTKTSLDRLKQPMPYKGRKELMNFLHETMQNPKKSTMPPTPVSQRKRVAAPFGSVDQKLFILTPMPLHSGGSAVAGSGMFNNKGHGKHRREGPCVGTKGFRAPEVLFRSFHQGCKVDVWSAGVTLLYLIIGRTPFGGDPEQNIKEIAKLKGSEELWEVAKLHNCESSYPSDLFDVKFPQSSVDLRDWCAANTRRPDLLDIIPGSFFNLLDKCLAVNPRCRLSSEDALRHEFFAPCRDDFRKLRMPRKSADAACSSSHQNTALPVKQS